MSTTEDAPRSARVATGVPGLDAILHGGLFERSSTLVFGPSGAGKTILGNQIVFHHVRQGGRAVYITLLTETHGRMLDYLRTLSFFDDKFIPDQLSFIGGYQHLIKEGMANFLHVIHKETHERGATMLVLDGIAVIEALTGSTLEFQKFIQQLSALVAAAGCTLLLLANSQQDRTFVEHGMVDSVMEVSYRFVGVRSIRQLAITKLRGSDFIQGRHTFRITSDGIVVFPRLEAMVSQANLVSGERRTRKQFGIARLDEMLEGGVNTGSTTALLGAPGAGKTLLGVNFLATGGAAGERGLYFGFYESPPRLIAKADAIGLNFSNLMQQGLLDVVWQAPVERFLDELAHQLLDIVRQRRVERVFIDGIDGFLRAAMLPERLPAFFTALCNELRFLGVTTLFSEELELFQEDIDAPIAGMSAMVENLILLRYVEYRAHLHRLISILKMRESGYDSALREFTISRTGIDVAETFHSAEAVLTGRARAASIVSGRSSGRSRRKP